MAASKKPQGAPAPAKAPAEGATPASPPAPAAVPVGAQDGAAGGQGEGSQGAAPASPATPATPAAAEGASVEIRDDGITLRGKVTIGSGGASVASLPAPPPPGDGVARPIEGGPFPPASLLPTEAKAPEAFALGIDPAHPGEDRTVRTVRSAPPGDEEDLEAILLEQQGEIDRLREEVRQLKMQLDEANAVVAAARADHAADREAWLDEQAKLLTACEQLQEQLRKPLSLEVHLDGEPRPQGHLPPLETDERGNVVMRERTFPGRDEAPFSEPPPPAPLPPGHVRCRVKRGSVVLSVGTRREADGPFDIAAWEIRGLEEVVEVLAGG